MAERSVLPKRPGNSGGGKGPQLKTDARSNEGHGELTMSLATPGCVQKLQTASHVTSCVFSESRMREICLSGSMSGLCQEDEKSSCCTKDEGGPFGCAKKKCKLHAVREMREGPSKPLCRERLQTATSCCGTMATVVNVVVKSVDRPRQVWMRETNASEPPIKHRNLLRRRQNRGLRGAPGSVWWKPVYWPDGVRCIGGVTLI